jgi:hypothetical protein
VSEGWRRERDSNPRAPFGANGFQDRRLKPLGHPSERGNSQSLEQEDPPDACGTPGAGDWELSLFSVYWHWAGSANDSVMATFVPLMVALAPTPTPYFANARHTEQVSVG